jgi:hypothetical protein
VITIITFILFLCFAALALEPEANEYSFPLTVAAFIMFVGFILASGQ